MKRIIIEIVVHLAKLGASFRGHEEDDYLKIKDMFIFNLRFALFCFGLKNIDPFLRIIKFRHTKSLGHAPPLRLLLKFIERLCFWHTKKILYDIKFLVPPKNSLSQVTFFREVRDTNIFRESFLEFDSAHFGISNSNKFKILPKF